MEKELIDFTVKELVNKRLKGFPRQDPDTHAPTDKLCDAIATALQYKIAQRQDEINSKLFSLTKWLVGLTILLVVLTFGLLWLTYKLAFPY